MVGVLLAFALLLACSASAGPITVASFTFAAGESAFADDGFLVSGSIRIGNCTGGPPVTTVQEALAGSDTNTCVNATTTEGGFVELRFTDNSITNGPGADLVIFELSGPLSPGTPDPRERFSLSIFTGGAFSPFVAYDPVATGVNSGADPTLDIFVAQVDLTAFGVGSGGAVNRLQLHIYNNNLGTKSADIVALGALNSGSPIPEPSTLLLVASGLMLVALKRQCWRADQTGPTRA